MLALCGIDGEARIGFRGLERDDVLEIVISLYPLI
jgi:hypothetical protein